MKQYDMYAKKETFFLFSVVVIKRSLARVIKINFMILSGHLR